MNVEGTVFGPVAVTRAEDPRDSSKYIDQTSIVGSEMLGLRNGNVILVGSGEAQVTLPDWFDKVYGDFRYTLTAVGAPGPNLYVAQEIKANQFTIAGGKPGMKVSWEVSGVRQDKYAREHPLKVEVNKADMQPPAAADPAISLGEKAPTAPTAPNQPGGKQ